MIDWQANLNQFAGQYRPVLNSCFMVGSLVYQSKFRKTSDIDLIAVIDDLDFWRLICTEYVKTPDGFAEESIDQYLSGAAQYLCLNYDFRGIPYSVDFVLPDFFRRAAAWLQKDRTVIYHRVTDQPIEDGYEFGCGMKRISPPKHNYRRDKSILVATPLCIVDHDFYFGLHLDKLITGYQTLWGEDRDLIFFLQ